MLNEIKRTEKFFSLLEEMNKEVNYGLVEIEFGEHSIFMKDGFEVEEENLLIGQEGMTFYGVHEAVEFLEKNGLLE